MSGLHLRAGALVIAAFALSANVAHAAHDIDVQSGDTFRFDGRRIRIANIDTAPVDMPRCNWEKEMGVAARDKLVELLAAGEPQVVPTGQLDQFSRTLALVSVNGNDVGEAMIAARVASPRGHLRQFCVSRYGPGDHGQPHRGVCCNTTPAPQPPEKPAQPVEGNTEGPPHPLRH